MVISLKLRLPITDKTVRRILVFALKRYIRPLAWEDGCKLQVGNWIFHKYTLDDSTSSSTCNNTPEQQALAIILAFSLPQVGLYIFRGQPGRAVLIWKRMLC